MSDANLISFQEKSRERNKLPEAEIRQIARGYIDAMSYDELFAFVFSKRYEEIIVESRNKSGGT